ncbi:MAG: TerB family tellurite resistance protein [Hellea sp.]
MMQLDLHNILSLLTATIMADKHVYASEIDVFLKSTNKSKLIRHLDPKISEAKLLTWYELNKDGIAQKLVTPHFKDWLYDILEKLSDVSQKQTILELMRGIAIADDDVHVSEKALITLAERYWGVN